MPPPSDQVLLAQLTRIRIALELLADIPPAGPIAPESLEAIRDRLRSWEAELERTLLEHPDDDLDGP